MGSSLMFFSKEFTGIMMSTYDELVDHMSIWYPSIGESEGPMPGYLTEKDMIHAIMWHQISDLFSRTFWWINNEQLDGYPHPIEVYNTIFGIIKEDSTKIEK